MFCHPIPARRRISFTQVGETKNFRLYAPGAQSHDGVMKDEPAPATCPKKLGPVLISISTAAVVAFSPPVRAQQSPATEAKPKATESETPIPGELPAKIEFLGRFAQNYTLTFSSKPDEVRFQVTREQTANYARATSIPKIGETTQDGKVRLEKYVEKSGKNGLGIEVDTSELVVIWLETGQEYTLVRRVPVTIPTYFAKLRMPATDNSPMEEDYIREGDQFTHPSDPKLKYRLAEIQMEKATVEFTDAEGTLRKAAIALEE